MTWKKIEDIEVWQWARTLSQQVYTMTLAEPFSRDFSLVNQIRASSGSVMDNIAEGFERGGNKEFVNFLVIAKGSNGEVRSQLYRALDRSYISQETFQETIQLSELIGAKLFQHISYLRQSEFKGNRYK